MEQKDISVLEAAKMLGITRQAVLKRIKAGELLARKIGRSYVIREVDLPISNGGALTDAKKELIDDAVKKTLREYSETLKLLGRE